MVFPVVMYRCENWTRKKAECQSLQTLVLEKTLERPLDCKEIKPVNPKGNQPWIVIGRTDAEAEAPILWPPDVKSWLIAKDPDAGKDWGQEEGGVIEDEMVGWHHGQSIWLTQWTKFEQAPGDSEGQGNLACCSPWGCKLLDTTWQLNNKHQNSPKRIASWLWDSEWLSVHSGFSAQRTMRTSQEPELEKEDGF